MPLRRKLKQSHFEKDLVIADARSGIIQEPLKRDIKLGLLLESIKLSLHIYPARIMDGKKAEGAGHFGPFFSRSLASVVKARC